MRQSATTPLHRLRTMAGHEFGEGLTRSLRNTTMLPCRETTLAPCSRRFRGASPAQRESLDRKHRLESARGVYAAARGTQSRESGYPLQKAVPWPAQCPRSNDVCVCCLRPSCLLASTNSFELFCNDCLKSVLIVAETA